MKTVYKWERIRFLVLFVIGVAACLYFVSKSAKNTSNYEMPEDLDRTINITNGKEWNSFEESRKTEICQYAVKENGRGASADSLKECLRKTYSVSSNDNFWLSVAIENCLPKRIAEPPKSLNAELAESPLLTKLSNNLTTFDKPFDASSYRGSKDALTMEMALFYAYTLMITEGEQDNSNKVKVLAKKLKSKVVALQAKEFPLMRKELVRILDEAFWEENVSVKCLDQSCSSVLFVGGAFASNKNIKALQEGLGETPQLYRFKKMRYRWYEDADGTVYTIPSPKDTELVNP